MKSSNSQYRATVPKMLASFHMWLLSTCFMADAMKCSVSAKCILNFGDTQYHK